MYGDSACLERPLGRRVKDSLRWLHDMALFYTELKAFLSTLPPETPMESMISIPEAVATDPRYRVLNRVSRDCRYMPNIPRKECAAAMEIVQDLSRDAFLEVSRHPSLNVFQGEEGRREPFFEKAMIFGSCLAVEHGIDVCKETQDRRRRSKGKSLSQSDDLGLVCDQFGMGRDVMTD